MVIARWDVAGASVGASVLAMSLLVPAPAAAQCSVFSRHPCAQVVACSVFHRGPCIPDFGTPVGEDLRLTIESKTPVAEPSTSGEGQTAPPVEEKVNTIRAMFAALRACWVPPAEEDAKPGMQMSVRFAFKRNGEIIGPPRVTFTTPSAAPETRDVYRKAIMASFERCTPLHFTDGMAGAIAGKPIAIRFVDNRTFQREPDDTH
jgi:hypothetical protein